MAEYSELKLKYASIAYDTLCAALDEMKWTYTRDAANRVVTTSAIGTGVRINLRMVVSEERQVMYVKSTLPFEVPSNEAVRNTFGKALHVANYSMLNGCFEYDVEAGKAGFKIVVPFFNSTVTKEVYRYAIMLTCQTMDKFTDKLLALLKGHISLEEFCQFANG